MLLFIAASQNENNKWYFGNHAGLDFNTSPPTVLTNGAMNAPSGCASVADASGNLLFYTDGITIWDKTHSVMANGTGLLGSSTVPQPALIQKQPGSSSIYYVFSTSAYRSVEGLYYSIVDLSLSAGNGSVTVKNATLASSAGQIAATPHCNGKDIWIVSESYSTNTNHLNSVDAFTTFLLTSSGLNTSPVYSGVTGMINNYVSGCLKISPNGKKVAHAHAASVTWWAGFQTTSLHLLNFDNATGIVSDGFELRNSTTNPIWNHGAEFSPDGTKLYAPSSPTGGISQWNLCAGSNSAIIASETQISTMNGCRQMQLAPDGKIYFARIGDGSLGIINSPNALGLAANCTSMSIIPGISSSGLPNIMNINTYTFQPPPSGTIGYTANPTSCKIASFSYSEAPFSPTYCSQTYSLTGYLWNFGDPSSGTANTTTLSNPSHTFTASGQYLVQLIVNHSCKADTINRVVNIPNCFVITSSQISCSSLGSATLTSASLDTHTWLPVGQTGSVATGLYPGTYTVITSEFGTGFTFSTTVTFTSPVTFTGSLNTRSITCFGLSNGMAGYTVTGGTANQYYLWSNGVNNYTVSNPNTLSAGLWSVIVTDAITNCSFNNTFVISQPPPLTLTATVSSPTACAGNSIILTGNASGGVPAYLYSWTNGSSSQTYTVTQAIGGVSVYSITANDANGCVASATVAANFVNNPVISVTSVSICPYETATLIASGAGSYTWSSGANGPVITDNPTITTQYTVTGSASACSSSQTATITLKSLPQINFNSNSPLCEGQNLIFSAQGGTAFNWVGPSAFSSSAAVNFISAVTVSNGGVYTATTTGLNSCTNSAAYSITVNPTPTIAATGATICEGQSFILTSSVSIGSGVSWVGPDNFTSSIQSPVIINATNLSAGVYSVTATIGPCSANTTVNVQVKTLPIILFTGNSPLCEGQNLVFSAQGGTAYSWVGPSFFVSSTAVNSISIVTPGNGGVYTTTVTGANSCTNSAGYVVTINPSPTLSAVGATICESQSFTLSANTTTGSVISWLGPDNFMSGLSNPVIGNAGITAAGIYTVTSAIGPCSITNTVGVVVNVPLSPTLTSNSPVCNNAQLMLYANVIGNGAAFMWNGPTGFTSAVNNPTLTNVISTNAGIYTLTATDGNNCQRISTLSVAVLPTPTLVTVSSTVCLNETSILSVSGAASYTWINQGNPFAFSSSLSIASATNLAVAPTIYTVIGRAANSCTSMATTSVSTLALPTPTVSFVPANHQCIGSDFVFKGDGAKVYKWQGPNGMFYQGQQVNFKAVDNSYAGTYSLSVTDSLGCKGKMTFSLSLDSLPRGSMEGTLNGCVPFCSEYKFKPQVAISPVTNQLWYINGIQQASSSFSNCFAIAGDYVLKGIVTNSAGCVNTISYIVRAYTRPVADFLFTPDKPVEGEDEVNFSNFSSGAGRLSFSWYFASNVAISNEKNPAYMFNNKGVYPVALVVQNDIGCADTAVKIVNVNPSFTFFAPNAFTPNGDERNENFTPVTRGVRSYELRIYNRWGMLLFKSNDSAEGWNGRFSGEDCKQDVYVWKVNLTTLSGDIKQYSGVVTLLR